MIKANDVTKAIVEAFENDAEFNSYNVERSEYVNEDPNHCPWIGIYRGDITYAPETLGDGPDYWTGLLTIRLVVQASNLYSGAQAEDDLETIVESVVSKMFSDTTIRGIVDMVNDLKVTYSYKAEDEDSMYFQSAIIELTLEVSTA